MGVTEMHDEVIGPRILGPVAGHEAIRSPKPCWLVNKRRRVHPKGGHMRSHSAGVRDWRDPNVAISTVRRVVCYQRTANPTFRRDLVRKLLASGSAACRSMTGLASGVLSGAAPFSVPAESA